MYCIQGSPYSTFLHDAVYLYMLSFHQTLTAGKDPRDGELMFEAAKNITFPGEFELMFIFYANTFQLDMNV